MSVGVELMVDEVFRSLLWPLGEDERASLEESLKREGCRDPIVAWVEDGFDVIVDGHNRYEICTRLGIPFQVVYREFESRTEAEDWIDRNQASRRNCTPEQMRLIRGRIYNRTKRQGERTDLTSGQNVQKLETTAESVAKQFGVNEKTIRRDGQLAEAVEVLGITEDYTKGQIKATASEVVEAAKPIVEAKKAEDRWQREVEQRPFAPPPKPTPVEPVRIEAIKEQLKTPHVARNSGDNEWYTPSVYILAAKAVFGEIDLDPASSEIANKTVGAKTFFTAEQDGLSQAWPVGRIWMNPPYAQPLISRFCERIVDEIARGSSAIVLVNNGTETQWFQGMAEECSAVCFPRSRIKFLDPEGNPGAPLQGQAVVYFGGDPDSFKEHFSQFGEVFFHG